MNLRSLALAAAVAAATLPAQAVTVVQWNFESATAPSASTTWSGIAASTGTGSAGGVHAASTTWTTPAGNGSTKAMSGNTWGIGDYWQFSFSTVGYSGLTVSWDQISSGTGPTSFTLAYSTDGSTFTNFAGYTVLNTGSWSSGTASSTYSFSDSLAAVPALNNAAMVYLRLVNGSAVAAGGTDRVDNFTVATASVPEAATSAMWAAGLAALSVLARRRNAA